MRKDRGGKTEKEKDREIERPSETERKTGREKEKLNPEYRNTQTTGGLNLRWSSCLSLRDNLIVLTLFPSKLCIAIFIFKVKGFFFFKHPL